MWIAVNLGFIPRPWFCPTTCCGGRGDFGFFLLRTKTKVEKCCLSFSARDIKKGVRKPTFGARWSSIKREACLFLQSKQRKEASILLHSQVTTKKRESFTFLCFASVYALDKGRSQNRAGALQSLGTHSNQREKTFAPPFYSRVFQQVGSNPTQPYPTKVVAKCRSRRMSSTLVTSAAQKMTKKVDTGRDFEQSNL